jgi:hypothetical protein
MSTAQNSTATTTGDAPSRLRTLRLPPAARPYPLPLALYGTAKLTGLLVFAWLLEYAGDYRHKDPRFGGGAHW